MFGSNLRFLKGVHSAKLLYQILLDPIANCLEGAYPCNDILLDPILPRCGIRVYWAKIIHVSGGCASSQAVV